MQRGSGRHARAQRSHRRIDEETGEHKRFSSEILPPWCRKSPKVSEVLPLLYLHGLSSGDFVPAPEQFLGSAAGLPSATVTRLTRQWQDDHAVFQVRDLSDRDFVYVWPDGVTKVTRGAGSPGRGSCDGVQARRVRPDPLARN